MRGRDGTWFIEKYSRAILVYLEGMEGELRDKDLMNYYLLTTQTLSLVSRAIPGLSRKSVIDLST